MPRPPEPVPGQGQPGTVRLLRFDRVERLTHRSFAVLMGVCILTAGMLYLPGLSELVGQRDIVRMVHLVSGSLLPVPLILGLIVSARFRHDAEVLNRFTADDWRWFRRNAAPAPVPVGKFNAGQKLNSAFTVGATLVMLATGYMIIFATSFADRWRTGATFTHDWLAVALVIVVLGHLWKAFGDPEARVGMRTGEVSLRWAEREHPLWAAEQLGQEARSTTDPSA